MQSANFSSEEHRIKESEYILDFWQWFFKINVTEKVIWRWRYFVIYQNICQMKKKKTDWPRFNAWVLNNFHRLND